VYSHRKLRKAEGTGTGEQKVFRGCSEASYTGKVRSYLFAIAQKSKIRIGEIPQEKLREVGAQLVDMGANTITIHVTVPDPQNGRKIIGIIEEYYAENPQSRIRNARPRRGTDPKQRKVFGELKERYSKSEQLLDELPDEDY
jgi:hypothetical protein